MNRCYLIWCIGIFYFLIPISVTCQFADLEFARSEAHRLHEGILVVRLPVNAPKIRYYKTKLKEVEVDKNRKALLKELNNVMELNRLRFENIQEALSNHYTFSQFAILPDSNYLAFLAGKRDVFLNKNGLSGEHVSIQDNNYFLLITGENEDQWVLVNSDLRRLDSPFPHRATIFLSGLTRVLNCKKYYIKQMLWFQQKLSELI